MIDWDRHYCSKHINAYNTYSVGANWKNIRRIWL